MSESGAMAGVELLIDRTPSFLRAAVVVAGRLTDLHLDSTASSAFCPQAGSVWLGRVERVVSGLNAAFIDLGTERSGLLGLADVRLPGGRRSEPGTSIGTLVRAGQGVLVQVKAEAVGRKGPTLSMDVSLPGRFLVHAPFRRGVTVSRRVEAGAVRAALSRRLQAVTIGDGWIARAGTERMTDDGLLEIEATALAMAWRDLERAASGGRMPRCLASAPDAAQRAVIGHGVRPLARIIGGEVVSDLADWCVRRAPDLLPKLEPPASQESLFERYDLAGQITALTRPEVPLSGGAGLIIEHTEALTAIDVNGGERGTPLAVNLEAASEIGRQLRLRNIGGIVVVDFLSMSRRADGQRLLDALSAAVEDDPVQTEVYGLSRLGLIELTRARRGPMLADLLSPKTPVSR